MKLRVSFNFCCLLMMIMMIKGPHCTSKQRVSLRKKNAREGQKSMIQGAERGPNLHVKLYDVARRYFFALVVDGLAVLSPNLPSLELLALARADYLTHSLEL